MAAFGEFRIGAVVRRTIDILGGDMPSFLGIALLFSLLPQVLSLVIEPQLASAPGGGHGGPAAVASILSGFLVFAVSTFGKGAAVAAALAACEGRPWSFRSAVGVGAAALPSNLGVLVLDYLGIGFASILLVFPGLMLTCRWIVALPASMVERPGVRAALERSRDLTDGHRWPIFGLLLVFALLSAVVPAATLFVGSRQAGSPSLDAGTLVEALSAAVFGLVADVGLAVLYVELRAAKGDAPSTDLVSAFE